MIPAAFDYKVADSAEAAISMLGEYGDEAKLLAGGHSLIPMMKFRLAAPTVLIDVARIDDLSYIRQENGHLAIGSMTRHTEVEHSDLVQAEAPMLAQLDQERADAERRRDQAALDALDPPLVRHVREVVVVRVMAQDGGAPVAQNPRELTNDRGLARRAPPRDADHD